MSDEITLPWHLDGLQGARSDGGPTYNGGRWDGGSRLTDRSIAVRYYAPMGRMATVEVDLGDESQDQLGTADHGCTVSLTPDQARTAAAALLAAADRADAEIQRWRDVLDKQRAELDELRLRDIAGRAGQ